MPYAPIGGLPRHGGLVTATPRHVFKGMPTFLRGSILQIDGATSADAGNTGDVRYLRAGKLMGKITSGGQYAPSIMGVTTGAVDGADTSISAAAATVTELVRRVGASGTFKLVGPAAAAGTVVVTTVTYSAASGTTITVTAPAVDAISGSFICPTDGSEFPVTILAGLDGYPVRVVDADAASEDQEFPQVAIGGEVDSSQIIDWPSDTSLQSWIVSRLNGAEGGQFVFDHLY